MNKKNFKDANLDSNFNSIKQCWDIGSHKVVIIDKKIVKDLNLDEFNIFLEQHITKNGEILMKVRRIK